MTDTKELVERVQNALVETGTLDGPDDPAHDGLAALSELEAEVKRLTVALDATVTRAEAAERERDELRALLPETAMQETKARIARVAELEEALREIATTVTRDDTQGHIARAALNRATTTITIGPSPFVTDQGQTNPASGKAKP